MRYRVKDSTSNSVVTLIETNASGCSAPVSTSLGNAKVGEKLETWDVDEPGFYRKRRAGIFSSNPYTNSRVNRFNSIQGCSTIAVNPWPSTACRNQQVINGPHLTTILNTARWGGDFPPQKALSNSEINQALQICATKVHAKVADGDAELLVSLAELKQTVALLRSPLNNFLKFLAKVAKDKSVAVSVAKRSLTVGQYLVAEWLTYRYGVRPLIKDIQDILKAVSRDKIGMLHTARAQETRQKQFVWHHDVSHGHLKTSYDVLTQDEVIVKCGITFNAEMTVMDFLGLSPSNLPSVAWELIPFSFVVDWFVNIGTYIKALRPHPFVKQRNQYSTITRSITSSIVPTGTELVLFPTASTLLRQMSGAETVVSRVKTRLITVPAPSIRSKIRLPDFNLSDLRILDLLALIFQRLGTR